MHLKKLLLNTSFASAMWSYADQREAVRQDRANSEWRNVATLHFSHRLRWGKCRVMPKKQQNERHPTLAYYIHKQ
jgi:hypothetical protein